MEVDEAAPSADADNCQREAQEEEGGVPHLPMQRTLLWSGQPRECSDAAAAVPSFLGPFDVSQFYRTGLYSDLVIVCADGDKVRVHQAILGATCANAKRILMRFVKFSM